LNLPAFDVTTRSFLVALSVKMERQRSRRVLITESSSGGSSPSSPSLQSAFPKDRAIYESDNSHPGVLNEGSDPSASSLGSIDQKSLMVDVAVQTLPSGRIRLPSSGDGEVVSGVVTVGLWQSPMKGRYRCGTCGKLKANHFCGHLAETSSESQTLPPGSWVTLDSYDFVGSSGGGGGGGGSGERGASYGGGSHCEGESVTLKTLVVRPSGFRFSSPHPEVDSVPRLGSKACTKAQKFVHGGGSQEQLLLQPPQLARGFLPDRSAHVQAQAAANLMSLGRPPAATLSPPTLPFAFGGGLQAPEHGQQQQQQRQAAMASIPLAAIAELVSNPQAHPGALGLMGDLRLSWDAASQILALVAKQQETNEQQLSETPSPLPGLSGGGCSGGNSGADYQARSAKFTAVTAAPVLPFPAPAVVVPTAELEMRDQQRHGQQLLVAALLEQQNSQQQLHFQQQLHLQQQFHLRQQMHIQQQQQQQQQSNSERGSLATAPTCGLNHAPASIFQRQLMEQQQDSQQRK